MVKRMPPYPLKPIVPYVELIHDRVGIELFRGCTRGCRYCQAGMIYRPVRERTKEEVLAMAETLFRNTGYEQLSLVSLASGDYSELAPLIEELVARYGDKGLNISLPSLRVDSFSVDITEPISGQRKGSFTFAPEAGTQRLRDGTNKGVTEEDLYNTAELVYSRGWTTIKLYFMVGLPTETIEDVEGIVKLAQRVREIGLKHVGQKAQVRISASTFVPKAHSPFQWAAQNTPAELAPKHAILKNGLRGKGFHLNWTEPETSILEAVFSRGDRRTGEAILRAWQKGCRFDAWSEQCRYDLWQEAFAEAGLDPAWYAHREYDPDEVLPWQHIFGGVDHIFLQRERWRYLRNKFTPDCRWGPCAACGLNRIPGECDLFAAHVKAVHDRKEAPAAGPQPVELVR